MNDDTLQKDNLDTRAEELLARIEENTSAFKDKAQRQMSDMERGIEELEQELKKSEWELEKFGSDISLEMDASGKVLEERLDELERGDAEG